MKIYFWIIKCYWEKKSFYLMKIWKKFSRVFYEENFAFWILFEFSSYSESLVWRALGKIKLKFEHFIWLWYLWTRSMVEVFFECKWKSIMVIWELWKSISIQNRSTQRIANKTSPFYFQFYDKSSFKFIKWKLSWIQFKFSTNKYLQSDNILTDNWFTNWFSKFSNIVWVQFIQFSCWSTTSISNYLWIFVTNLFDWSNGFYQ